MDKKKYTLEELKEYASDENLELSDEAMDKINGGVIDANTYVKCLMSGANPATCEMYLN